MVFTRPIIILGPLKDRLNDDLVKPRVLFENCVNSIKNLGFFFEEHFLNKFILDQNQLDVNGSRLDVRLELFRQFKSELVQLLKGLILEKKLSNGHSTANLLNSSTRRKFAIFGEFKYSPKWSFWKIGRTR